MRGLRRWRWLAALAALAIAVATVAVLRTTDPADESQRQGVGIREGGTVRVAATFAVSGFNPNTSKDNSTAVQELAVTIYPSVFRIHPDLSVRLDQTFMTSAELTSHDPQTITYQIRPEARWSDGEPISATDFHYRWQNSNGSNSKIDTASTTGYDRIRQVTGSADSKTVTVVFRQNFADWQALFANLVPAHYVGRQAGGWNHGLDDDPEDIPSGGPFKIAGFRRGETLTLQRNDNYWGPKAHLDQILIRHVPDSDAQLDALRNHEADLIAPDTTADLVNHIRQLPGVRSQASPTLSLEQLTFNLKHPILGELAVRRAIATAIDTEQLVDRLLRPVDPNAQPLGNRIWLTSHQPYQDHSGGYGNGDTEAAKQLLEQAGWTLGGDGVYTKDGKRLELRYATFTGDPRRTAEGQLLQAQLADAGIRLRIDNRPISTFFESVFDGDFDIADFFWNVTFAISGNQDIYRTGGGGNPGGFSDPTVDALFQQAIGELDPARAAALGNQIDQRLWTQLPLLPLYQLQSVLAWREDLANVGNSPAAEGPFWNAGSWGFARP